MRTKTISYYKRWFHWSVGEFEKLQSKMKDEDIDLSDAPEITPEMFAKAIVRRGLKPRTKTQLTLRVDSEVLEWHKK